MSERMAGGLPCVGMVAVEAAVISNETFCQGNRLTHLECPRSGAGSRLRIRDCAYSFETRRTISLLTATSIVVGNMIGTGIFTSLGFQIGDLRTGFSVMAVWAIGGVCAMCGALAYAELGAALPRSGGEYNFLSRIYHPSVGFLAGWISATVGFAAPVAIAAKPFGDLPRRYFSRNERAFLSLAVVWITTFVLLQDLRLGSLFQNASTVLKVALILVIIVGGFFVKSTQAVSFFPRKVTARLFLAHRSHSALTG